MHSRSNWLALAFGIFFLISSVAVEATNPLPPLPLPTPPPTPTPPAQIIVNPPPLPSVNPEESFPVVISYGQNQETRARIYRGVMDPVGMPPSQIVTATVFFPVNRAGQPVRFGLYDGGQIATSVAGGFTPNIEGALVSVDGTLQFNFQAGPTLGLYRLLVTVGAGQYLLQFYAANPRSGSGLTPRPSPSVYPPPLPTPPPIK